MSDLSGDEERKAMGRRLREVRETLRLTQAQMVKDAGVTVTAWSAWELGRNMIKLQLIAKTAKRHGFTTDYIAFGDISGVRKDLADKLLEREVNLSELPNRGRGRPKMA